MLRFIVPAAISTLLLALPLSAQGREGTDGIPPGHFPPAGMCRVWIDGVPPGQQAAPTDCTTAVRNRPANGRVIFGDDRPKANRDDRDDRDREKDADKIAREEEKELEKARRDREKELRKAERNREKALEKERDREKELEKAKKDGRVKQLKPKKTTRKKPGIIDPKNPNGI